MKRTNDKHPALLIKDAVLARSGVYVYSYDEMVARGYTPKQKKDYYKEYRPPEVLLRCKDKFAFAVVTREHTSAETTAENFRLQADGAVGDSITVEVLDDGNIGLKGKVAFYTKEVAEYYEQGNKETSADYRSKSRVSDVPEYDFILTDILSVNGLAITSKGRGGQSVRVNDSLKDKETIMARSKKGFLASIFGGKTADSQITNFSEKVFNLVDEFRTLDGAKKEERLAVLLEPVLALGDSEEKDYLIGAVTDSLNNPEEVKGNKEQVAKAIDGLFARCLDADKEKAKRLYDEVLNGKKGEDPEDKSKNDPEDKSKNDPEDKSKNDPEDKSKNDPEDKKTGGQSQDGLTVGDVENIIDKVIARQKDSIAKQVDEAVKKSLGIADNEAQGRAVDSEALVGDTKTDFLLDRAF